MPPAPILRDPETYDQWAERQASAPDASEVELFRQDPASDVFDAKLLKEHTTLLQRAREKRRAAELTKLLQEALYRHLGELADARLYEVSPLGTKYVVERFYEECLAAIAHLSDPDQTGLSPVDTLARFERAAHGFGRSALLLSGGASLGFFHMGVIKALFEHDLLPNVLSGASMGAMVACGIAARTDDELRELFTDWSMVRTDALLRVGPTEALRTRAVYDPQRLAEVIAHNNGDYTFAQAFERSGRAVNVSISPTRKRQKPRVLNHLTTPEVTLLSAAVASSSVPGAFPPATLMERLPDGRDVPYMPTELWIDGSFKGDLPMRRISRLHNVNHFIVSQVNPHVAPVRRVTRRRGVLPFVAGMATTTARVQLTHQLHIAKSLLQQTPLYTPLDLAHSLADQTYSGDIDIHPRLRAGALLRTFSNISREELAMHILEGERSTWPLLARIRDQTCVSRALDKAILSLRARGADRR
ncbi:MAG: DUF3336 domain-containing protein [Myxococcales bacterium]|nr:DUF3336 domain-containing protein [Myxococcales bacterium]MCB9626624.1 DUF3336 domain-containing protein [Sandaracinaceae bacterium]